MVWRSGGRRWRGIAWCVGALAFGAGACSTRTVPPLRVPYETLSATSARYDDPSLRAAHDAVLALFQQPALRDVALAADAQELRMSASGGWTYAPVSLLRLVRVRGRYVGEVYLWWPTFADTAHRHAESAFLADPYLRDHGCRTPVRNGQFAACRLQITPEPDWSRIGTQLDSLGVWQLPGSDQIQSSFAARGMAVTDQGGLRLERRRGAAYEFAWYYGVEAYPAPTGPRLAALYRLMRVGTHWR